MENKDAMSQPGTAEQPPSPALGSRRIGAFLSRLHVTKPPKPKARSPLALAPTTPQRSMTSDFLTPQQEDFESSQSEAWGSIRQDHLAIEEAASRIWQPPEDEAPPQSLVDMLRLQTMSPLERLPEETLVTIMSFLDHSSLYCLSQVTGQFLRLSFDDVFEADASWRTFRHTIDSLRGGLGERIQHRPTKYVGKGKTSGDDGSGEGSMAVVQDSQLVQGDSSSWNWELVYKYGSGKPGALGTAATASYDREDKGKNLADDGESMQEFLSRQSSWETASEGD